MGFSFASIKTVLILMILKKNRCYAENLPFSIGEPPNKFTDEIGLPLDQEDFMRALSIPELDAPHDISSAPLEEDPTVTAGYYQGDIILDSLQEYNNILKRTSSLPEGSIRNAILNLSERWPNGIIPYVISSYYNSTQRAMISGAIIAIQQNTCIRFVPRSTEKDFIHILNAFECSSRVGRKGGRQTVSFGPQCLFLGIMIHELMHTIGFWHEHSRWDRDDHIDIIWDNIPTGKEYNFEILDQSTMQTLGVDYDYGSLLHYGPYAFSKDPLKPTIIPKKNIEIGQRRFFSKSDIYKINLLYECPRDSYKQGPCIDKHDKCWIWGVLGECQKNSQWMKQNCQRSCGVCGKRAPCLDRNFYCSPWAKKGECHTNARYMSVYCPQSCHLCPHR